MTPLRFAVIGTGFWASYQVAAWKELEGVELVALYNRTKHRAEELARRFGVQQVYDDVIRLMENESLDFVDIISNAETHMPFTIAAAKKGVNIICQKPMATSLDQASQMLNTCKQHGVKLFIHENFRWQAPVRALKETMDSGIIGKVFKARVSFCSAFPVFDNQPFLAELDHFILTDIGSHILDICRFLFGEAKSLYCLAGTVNKNIRGEDVANVLMEMKSGCHCFAEMSYASVLEREAFPQTLVLVEGESGSIQLTHDFELKTTTREGTVSTVIKPAMYNWVDPAYAVVHSSIVDCNRNILNGLRGGTCETTGLDNFSTMQLVWAAYESVATNKMIML